MASEDDNPTNEELQQYEEQQVFLEFVEYSCLEINVDSIESRRSPEPDIYCDSTDGKALAFELGELCDQEFRLGYGTMLKSRELLRDGLDRLEPSVRQEFIRKYSDAFISVQFVPGASLLRRDEVIVGLYEWLMRSGLASGELDESLLPVELKGVVTRVVISRNRPQLMIEPGFAFAVSPPTLRVLEKKVRTQYLTDGRPIDLLLYSVHPFVSLENWLRVNEGGIRNELTGSKFRSVWIFFVPDRTTDKCAAVQIFPRS